jgi:hypothetical protein
MYRITRRRSTALVRATTASRDPAYPYKYVEETY